MALFVDLKVNRKNIGQIIAVRKDPVPGSGGWFEYDCVVFEYKDRPETEWMEDPRWQGTVEHRYSDGAWKLVERVVHEMEEHSDGS